MAVRVSPIGKLASKVRFSTSRVRRTSRRAPSRRVDEGDHRIAIVEAGDALVDMPEPPHRRMIVEPVGDRLLPGEEIAAGDPAPRMILDADLAPIGRAATYLDPLAIGAQDRGRAQPVGDRVANDLDRHRLGRRLGLERRRWALRRLRRSKTFEKRSVDARIGRQARRGNRSRSTRPATKLWLASAARACLHRRRMPAAP